MKHSTLDTIKNKNHPSRKLKKMESTLIAMQGKDTEADDASEMSPSITNVDHVIEAPEYGVGVVPVTWVANDNSLPVGYAYGSWISGTGAGMFLVGQAKETSTYSIVSLSTLLDTDSFSNLGDRPNFFIRSTGLGQFRFDGGTVDTLGSQGLGIYTNVNDTTGLNNVLYLYSKSKGTAAAGFGVGVVFYIEDDGGNEEAAANLGARWTSAVNAAETAKYQASLKQGGTLYDYGLGLLKYIAAGNTTITTSETTLFDRTVAANWLAGDNLIRLTCNAVTVATTARTITWNLYYDDTVIATWTEATGSNATGYIDIQASLVSTGSNAQRAFVTSERYNATAGAEADQKVVGAATEDTTTVKNVKLTAQLSGAVTSAVVRNLVVEYLNGTQ